MNPPRDWCTHKVGALMCDCLGEHPQTHSQTALLGFLCSIMLSVRTSHHTALKDRTISALRETIIYAPKGTAFRTPSLSPGTMALSFSAQFSQNICGRESPSSLEPRMLGYLLLFQLHATRKLRNVASTGFLQSS